MITIDINDTVTPALRELQGKLASPQRAAMSAGRQVGTLLREHFNARNATPNRNHFPRANFWAKAARHTVGPTPAADGAVITVRQAGVALALHGGTRRKARGMYAIPARSEAAGKFPREFNNLRFAILGDGGPALVGADKNSARGNRSIGGGSKKAINENRGLVFYWLRKETHHRPDLTVLPDDAELDAAVRRGLAKYLGDQQP
jgi:hypothetical protein